LGGKALAEIIRGRCDSDSFGGKRFGGKTFDGKTFDVNEGRFV
jgi:hypothetical protein